MQLGTGNPNLRGYTRTLIGDPSGAARPMFTTQEIDDFINLGYFNVVHAVQRQNPFWFATHSTQTTVADQEIYSFPAGSQGILQIEVDYDGEGPSSDDWNPVKLDRVGPEQFQDAVNAGTTGVYLWVQHHNSFRIYPTVESGSTGSSAMRILHNFTPTALSTSSDEPTLPAMFHDVIALDAAFQAKVSIDEDVSLVAARLRDRLSDLTTQLIRWSFGDTPQFPNAAIRDEFDPESPQGRFGVLA